MGKKLLGDEPAGNLPRDWRDRVAEAGDDLDRIVRDVMARRRVRREVGVPSDVDPQWIARQATSDQNEIQYLADVRRPLLFKAMKSVLSLARALADLQLAGLERAAARRLELSLPPPPPLNGQEPGPTVDDDRRLEASPLAEGRADDPMSLLCGLADPDDPAVVQALLFVLGVRLRAQSARIKRRPGRPRDLVVRRVADELRAAGLSDGEVASVMRSEGIEGPTGSALNQSAPAAKERARTRRRRATRRTK